MTAMAGLPHSCISKNNRNGGEDAPPDNSKSKIHVAGYSLLQLYARGYKIIRVGDTIPANVLTSK